MSSKLVSFWDGVLATIKDACRVKTFSELEYFREFEEFAQQKLQSEEMTYKKCIREQKRAKKAILNYCVQVGKMKGLEMVATLAEAMPTKPSKSKTTSKSKF